MSKSKKEKAQPQHIVIGVLVVLISCGICFAAMALTPQQEKATTIAISVCARMNCDSDWLINNHNEALTFCTPSGQIDQSREGIVELILCLESQGVSF